MTDPINPPHYRSGSIECIDAIESMLTDSPLTPYQAFLSATAVKYLWRLGRKGDAATDAGKAAWYVGRLAESFKRGPSALEAAQAAVTIHGVR